MFASSYRQLAGIRVVGTRASSAGVLIAVLLLLAHSPATGQEVSGLAAAAAIEQAMIDCIAKAEKSVVSIARIRGDQQALGSIDPSSPDFIPNEFATGVIVDRRGLILTNYHVLREESTYVVTTNGGQTYDARVRAADVRSDLAVLELDVRGDGVSFPPIEYGDAKTLRKGQIVIALGNPYAIARDGQASASWGIVANLSRKASPNLPTEDAALPAKTKLQHFGTLIQTDAKLNLGTSGGPLLNLRGQMVGLVTSEAAIVGYEQAAGYAIPVDDTFRWVVRTLIEGREVEYGFLGVQPANVPSDSSVRGALLAKVVAGTPAHRANLRPNDVVLSVNGEPVVDVDSLMLNVGKHPVDSVVRLTVERNGRVMQLTPQLAKAPVQGGEQIATVPRPRWRGMQVDYNTVHEMVRVGVVEPGVTIIDVADDSPAQRAGVRANAFVTHVGGTPIESPKEFFAAVDEQEGPVTLRISTPLVGASNVVIQP